MKPDMTNLPPEFSSLPRLYGGVQLDEEEKVALELPVKYGLYRKVSVTQCKIDLEEALNKLRWNKIINAHKDRNGEHQEGAVGEGGNPEGGW